MGNTPAKSSGVHIDLVDSAQNLFDLLRAFDETPSLYSHLAVTQALRRYQQYWLPLLANHNEALSLPAPRDIEWVWYLHLLHPSSYQTYCEERFGKIVNHQLLSEDEREAQYQRSKTLWQTHYEGVEFEVDLNKLDEEIKKKDTNFDPSFPFDMISFSKYQESFSYRTSWPHFRDAKFLNEAVIRYETMIKIKMENPSTTLLPSNDILFIWCAHQMYPLLYQQHVSELLGNEVKLDYFEACYENTQLAQNTRKTKDLMRGKRMKYAVSGSMCYADVSLCCSYVADLLLKEVSL